MKKTTKQYSSSILSNRAVCSSCGEEFEVQPENVRFDEQGYGYSTRITKCPNCGKVVVMGYIEDYGLDINSDKRFYL